MTRIFKHVVADIDRDFIETFPVDFDYLSMIKQLSEEAEVDILMNGPKEISLKGIWAAMERVHELLTTALEMYGNRFNCTITDCLVSEDMLPQFKVHKLDESVSTENNNETSQSEIKLEIENPDLMHEETIQVFENNDLLLGSCHDNVSVDEQDDSDYTIPYDETDDVHDEPKSQKKLKKKRKNNQTSKPQNKSTGGSKEKKCKDCDFVTKSAYFLKKHRDWLHEGMATSCDICEKIFQNRSRMLKHRVCHDKEHKHCCEVCGKTYKAKFRLLEHIESHKEGYTRPSYQCDLCPKAFVSSYVLSCHIKKEHLGQKRSFLCSECGKSFTLKHSLQEHMNIHSGAKPNVCDICGKTFNKRSALHSHKVYHGEKSVPCPICNKMFYHKGDVKTHMRVHFPDTTEKPYACRLCLKSFYDTSKMRQHLRLVHKINKKVPYWREDVIYTKSPNKSTTHSSSNLDSLFSYVQHTE